MGKEYIAMTAVAIPVSLFSQLSAASIHAKGTREVADLAAIAIDEWLRRGHADLIFSSASPGYQWKDLFLPHGTVIRTSFGGKNFHAFVEHDQILDDARITSPHQFANQCGGLRRNAWKVIWVLFPRESEWRRAASLRRSTERQIPN